ncbi:hypothetical protein [Rhodoblastus sp.]|uniref:hypothetical protein n=1 Tax=Rhodoblastus sp. TaxID=1962975 RepID=UPI003F9E5DD3
MKQILSRKIAALLILAATIGASGAAEACPRATKAAWMASADQTRIAERDDADCRRGLTPNANAIGAIRPQQKFPGGTHR